MLGKWAGGLALVLSVGCVESSTQMCAGVICPDNTVCVAELRACYNLSAVESCRDQADGSTCALSEGVQGVCDRGVCFSDLCGDGVVSVGEACDDGNHEEGDGCSADCLSNESCGNGVVDLVAGEGCDCGDGSVALPGGCSVANSETPGAQCRISCVAHCGDGEINAVEQCEPDEPIPDTCVTVGYDRGALLCGDTCVNDFSGCGQMGFSRTFISTTSLLTNIDLLESGGGFAVGSGGFARLVDGAWQAETSEFNFNRVSATSSEHAFGILQGGTSAIVEYSQGQWSLLDYGPLVFLNDIWADGQGGFVAAGGGDSLRYDGTNFTALSSPQSINDVHGAADGTIMAAGEGGNLLKLTGSSWIPVLEGPAVSTYVSVQVRSATEFYGGTHDSQVIAFSGGTWEARDALSVGPIFRFWLNNLGQMLATGFGIASFFDGKVWLDVALPAGIFFYDVSGADRPVAVAGNSIYTLEPVVFAKSHELVNFSNIEASASGPGAVMASGSNVVDVYDGLRWTAEAIPINPSTYHMISLDDRYAVGGGEIYHHDGTDWSKYDDVSTAASGVDIWTDGTNFHSAGPGGLASKDSLGWQANALSSVTWKELAGDRFDSHFALGNSGGKSQIAYFDGTAWTLIHEFQETVREIYAESNELFAVGPNGIVHYFDGGVWSDLVLPSGDIVVDISGTSAEDIYVLTQSGQLWNRKSPGAWTQLRIPSGNYKDLEVTEGAVFMIHQNVIEILYTDL